MSAKEIVMIAGGNTGVRTSSAIWELFCQEYGIDPDTGCQNIKIPDLPVESFFELTDKKIIPRTIMINSPQGHQCIQRCEKTWNKKLYPWDSLISLNVFDEHDDFFIQGYRSTQSDEGEVNTTLERAFERIRVMCEKCSNLQGFVTCRNHYSAVSGFISRLLEELTDYEKKTKIDFAISTPTANLNFCLETRIPVLNTAFTMSHCMENIDCCFVLDTTAVYNICTRKLLKNENSYRDYHFHRLAAQAFSDLTAPLRFNWRYNWSLDNYKMLVPYKAIPFVTMSYAPLASPEKMMYHDQSIRSITNECLQRANQLLAYDPRAGAYISSLFLYRGSELIDIDIWNTLNRINAQCKEGILRCANGIEKPFQAKSTRCESTSLIGGDIGRPKQSVICCSNNTGLYYYWEKLILYLKNALKDKEHHDCNILDNLKQRFTKMEIPEYAIIEDLNDVNERLLDMLDRYAEFDSKIKHRRTAGFMSPDIKL